MGYGGNHNSTTRFRQYFAKAADTSDAIARPVIKEYTDKAHLLIPNKWYDIKIRVEKGITTYSVNGEELFRLPVKRMRRRIFRTPPIRKPHTIYRLSGKKPEEVNVMLSPKKIQN